VSIVPVLVGLVAISGLFLRSASARAQVVSHLSNALQGALSTREIEQLVTVSTQHAGLLGLIGFVGVLWGGSSIGGAISTAFQAIFEVQGRSFIKEKLIDIGMLFVFTILMLVIILGTTAGAIVTHLLTAFPVPGLAQAAGIAISLLAAVILFATIYLVFPNIQPRFKFGNVWRGAVVGAVLFTILSLIWPVYENFAHFGRYGTLLGPILLMAAWVYFFSMIVMIGAEVVAVGAIRGAEAQEKPVGPEPTESVPQHTVLRDRPKAS
jgi:membrane protein